MGKLLEVFTRGLDNQSIRNTMTMVCYRMKLFFPDEAGPSQAKKARAKPGLRVGLRGLLARLARLESPSPRPEPGLALFEPEFKNLATVQSKKLSLSPQHNRTSPIF